MARTLTINQSFSYADGSTTIATIPSKSTQITQTNSQKFELTKSVTTSEVSVTPTGITTNGECVIYNRDSTNYIEVGTTTGDYPIKIKAGRDCRFMLNAGKTLYLKANTATCIADIIVWAD